MTGLTPAPVAVIPLGGRAGPWPPWGLADWEIRRELTALETGPERREALRAEQEARRRHRAAALEHARQAAAEARPCVAAILGGLR